MLIKRLKKYNIILGSSSPRRKKLLSELGLKFKIKKTKKKENYPCNIKIIQIAEFLAKQKSEYLSKDILKNDLLITVDTIVSHKGKILHKPKTKSEAIKTLESLSGKTHKVITGVCLRSISKLVSFSSITEVSFNKLTQHEILHYIEEFKPYDKAGSYGIQEWIGYIGIKKINGSYNNVVGLPTSELYQELILFGK